MAVQYLPSYLSRLKLSLKIIKYSAFSIMILSQSALAKIPDQYQSESVFDNLASSITWKRLLHYPDDKSSSRVTDADFFVSPIGNMNPHAELKAMLQALKSNTYINGKSVQCSFPARTHWLTEQLHLTLPKVHCPKLEIWKNKYDPKELSVIFAQEYPDNMASAFAHTLLGIETKSSKNHEDAYAINYTVNNNSHDNTALFAINSMTGKYSGKMTIDPYKKKLDRYLKKDNRDIWTYPLNLTKQEQQQILRHIWEVKDLDIPYYFLTDNCASEILRLINVVRPDHHLSDQFNHFAIPSEIIRLLNKESLIDSGSFIPANHSKQQALINTQKTTSKNLKNKIYDTADNDPIQGHTTKKSSLSFGQSGDDKYIELGFRISYHDLLDPPSGYRQNLDMDALNFKVRHYQNIDNNLSQRYKKMSESLQLQEFTIIRGRSFHPINTAQDGDSWSVELSAKQIKDASVNYGTNIDKDSHDQGSQQEHLVGNIKFQKGLSYAFGQANNKYELPPHLCYALLGGATQFGRAITNGFRIGATTNIGCTYHANSSFRATSELNVPYWYHGDTNLNHRKSGYWQPTINLGIQYDLNKHHAIRLISEHEFNNRVAHDDNIQLSWQWYH